MGNKKQRKSLNILFQANGKKKAAGGIHCEVAQLPGRHYVEPMFSISMRAEDDRSQVNMFLDVGTVPGGTDVLNEFSLGGPKTEGTS
jgi:hypothetical protein